MPHCLCVAALAATIRFFVRSGNFDESYDESCNESSEEDFVLLESFSKTAAARRKEAEPLRRRPRDDHGGASRTD